jgi:hypothetical protein
MSIDINSFTYKTNINYLKYKILSLQVITATGLFTRGVLLNFYFTATNNTNDSNY